MRLSELELTDVFLASGHVEYRPRGGISAPRLPVPDDCKDDVADLRAKLDKIRTEKGMREFSLTHDKITYRVGVMDDFAFEPVYVLNRSTPQMPRVDHLGLSDSILNVLRDGSKRGLIVIAGDQRQGKTTSALVMLIDRMMSVGADGLVLQDPPELNVEGMYGSNRLYVQPVNGVSGYSQAAQQAMRFGINNILFGEIRRRDVAGSTSNAATALDISKAGCFIIATTHGSSVVDTVARLIELAADGMSNLESARAAVADSLLAVIWQQLEPKEQYQGKSTGMRVVTRVLECADEQDRSAVTSIIRNGKLEQLEGMIERQAERKLWS